MMIRKLDVWLFQGAIFSSSGHSLIFGVRSVDPSVWFWIGLLRSTYYYLILSHFFLPKCIFLSGQIVFCGKNGGREEKELNRPPEKITLKSDPFQPQSRCSAAGEMEKTNFSPFLMVHFDKILGIDFSGSISACLPACLPPLL